MFNKIHIQTLLIVLIVLPFHNITHLHFFLMYTFTYVLLSRERKHSKLIRESNKLIILAFLPPSPLRGEKTHMQDKQNKIENPHTQAQQHRFDNSRLRILKTFLQDGFLPNLSVDVNI